MNGQTTNGRPRRRAAERRAAIAAMVLGVLPLAAALAADEPAATTPDPLHTATALHARTTGFADPLDRDCPMPSEHLSLAIAVDVALCRNPSTRAAWAAARQQAAALGSAESAWLPVLSATGGATRYQGAHVDVTGNRVSTPETTRDAALNLSWTLYDFGARGGRIAGARASLEAQGALVSSAVQQAVLAVAQGYYSALAAEATLASAKTTESTAAQSVEIAHALRDGGVATLADVLQAETARDQALIARVQAEAALRSARGALAVAMGTTADQPMKLKPDPVPAEAPALSARIADLMGEAMRQRPDLAAARAQREAAEANVAVARATGRPTIAVGAGRTWATTTGVPSQSYNQVGLTVTVPIFNGFSTTYGVRQAEAAVQQSAANEEQVRLNVSLGVWNAYYALASANEQLAATATLVKTAAQNEEVALGRYKSGVGTIIDVLTAQTGASTARLTRINAELAWQVGRAELALALGRLSGAEPLAALGTTP